MITGGVLITGMHGIGRISVSEELAELLESTATACGAIDLDWLSRSALQAPMTLLSSE
jgi:adenylylsulfate kinase-like enzyme